MVPASCQITTNAEHQRADDNGTGSRVTTPGASTTAGASVTAGATTGPHVTGFDQSANDSWTAGSDSQGIPDFEGAECHMARERKRIPPIPAGLWPQLGQVFNKHGLSLRKILFECERTPRGLLINLSHLRNLQGLALPIEAVMVEPAGRYRSQTTAGNAGRESFGPHGPGEGVITFTIPLNYLLPPNLRCLTITDDRN